jgi:hypothetical protein
VSGDSSDRDWRAWHEEYDSPDSRLARRLVIVQQRIRDALDASPPGPVRVISLCAGDGRDLLGVLRDHPRATDVQARLVELDPVLAASARDGAAALGLVQVEVIDGDASSTASYAGAVPADLVLACGVFGNIVDDDIRNTIEALPTMCAPGATVVWTRHRTPPDRTTAARDWFRTAGFTELSFDAPREHVFTVGAHRFEGQPQPFEPDRRLFTFVGYDSLR